MRSVEHLPRNVVLLLVSGHVARCSEFSSLHYPRWWSYALLPGFTLMWMAVIFFISCAVFRSISNEGAHPTQTYNFGDAEFERILAERKVEREEQEEERRRMEEEEGN